MKNTTSLVRLTAQALVLTVLGGCATHLPRFPSAKSRALEARAHRYKASPAQALIVHRRPWFAGAPFRINRPEPQWLSRTVVLRTGRKLGIFDMAALIGRASGVDVTVHGLTLPSTSGSAMAMTTQMPGVETPGTVYTRMSWDGTLRGLLDRVGARYGVFWRVRHGGVRFFRYEARTYRLSVSPQSKTLQNTITASGGVGQSSGGTGTGTQVSGASLGSGQMTIDQKGTIAPYQDVLSQIKTILDASSGGGFVTAGASLGTATVLAEPPVQSLVARYIRDVNRDAERNIAVTVRVYHVTLNSQNTLGGNLGAVFQTLHQNLQASFSGVTIPSTVGTGLSSMSLIVPTAATGYSEHFAGTNAIVQALASVGQVRLATSGTVITSNGEPAPLQAASQVGYLASSGTTAVATAGSTSTTLTPGEVTVGFTSDFLPQLLSRNRVRLEYSLELSSLQSMDTVTSGTSEIEVPTINEQSASQSVVLRNGQTLVLAGFEQTQKNHDDGVGILSGYVGRTRSRDWLVILIHVSEVRS